MLQISLRPTWPVSLDCIETDRMELSDQCFFLICDKGAGLPIVEKILNERGRRAGAEGKQK
jgi:hypothetical protein